MTSDSNSIFMLDNPNAATSKTKAQGAPRREGARGRMVDPSEDML
jgi:hypothetical protein